MSPIIGIGLASIKGGARPARDSIAALLGGALLTNLLAGLMTLVNTRLPFVVLQEISAEVLARTHPSPIDLVIALAGGLAAAYVLTRPNVSAALPGVAIATALMPPLSTIGIEIALARWDIGMKIEEKLTLGTLVLRIIHAHGSAEMAHNLREAGYGVIVVDGEGASGAEKLLYTIIKRKDLSKVAEVIHSINPKAFFSVEEVRSAESGIFPMQNRG
jgi:hypothetical protein